MKKSVLHISLKISLFWRYFSLLGIVMILFLISLTVSMNQSTKILKNQYLSQTETSFYESSSTFSRELLMTRALISSFMDSKYYYKVFLADTPDSPDEHYYFSQVAQSFAVQCSLVNSIEHGFVYLNRSSSCLIKNRYFPYSESIFSSYLMYEETFPMMDYFDALEVRDTLVAVPVNNVTYYRLTAPCLTLLIKPTPNQLYGFLFSQETILNYFNINTLPENTFLELTSSTGELLLSYNKPEHANDYITFSAKIPSINATASLGIPNSYFDDAIKDSRETAHLIFLLSLVLGTILCIAFALVGIRPFHFLIRKHALPSDGNKNEMAAIDTFLDHSKQNIERLQGMLLSNLLTRAFYGLTIQPHEYKNLATSLPLFQNPWRLAVIQIRPVGEETPSTSVTFDSFTDQLSENMICEHMSLSELCIIFPDLSAFMDDLQQAIANVNDFRNDIPQFICGISAPFTGIHHLSAAIRQAQFALPGDEERMLGQFTETSDSSAFHSMESLFDFKNFQQELSCWNEKEVLHLISQYKKEAALQHLKYPEETFYQILSLLRDAARTANMDLGTYENTSYLHNASSESNLKYLSQIAAWLFRQKEKLQISETRQLSELLVQYVKEHYSNPALSISVVAQEFCVSERFAHKAIQAVCGMNFTRLLLETRMQESARLLRETDLNNFAIAEACGYSAANTFYRNFKNYYDKTPAEYRETFGIKL